MKSSHSLNIQSQHLLIVRSILKHYLPSDAQIWVYGSRAKKNARQFSDLDLAIEASKPLSIHTLADLASAFEESDLPYKVDIIDWQTISDSFKNGVISQRILLSI